MAFTQRIFVLLLTSRTMLAEFNIDFQQKDYNLKVERIEVPHFSKIFYSHFNVATFKYNRTCTAFNMTVNFKFDASKLQVIVQAYKFLSNEYRLFPIRVQYSFCKAISQNFAGVSNWKCGNFTGCPFLKGRTYHICNWNIDPSKFPPRIPSGQYMSEYQYIVGSAETALTRAYGTVSRPEV